MPTENGDLSVQGSVIASQNVQAGGVVSANQDVGAGRDVSAIQDVAAGRNVVAGNIISANVDVGAGNNIVAQNNVIAANNVEAEKDIIAANNVEAGNDVSAANNVEAGNDVTAGNNVQAGNDVTVVNNIEVQNGDIVDEAGNIYTLGDLYMNNRGRITAMNSSVGAGYDVYAHRWIFPTSFPDYTPPSTPLTPVTTYVDNTTNYFVPGVQIRGTDGNYYTLVLNPGNGTLTFVQSD